MVASSLVVLKVKNMYEWANPGLRLKTRISLLKFMHLALTMRYGYPINNSLLRYLISSHTAKLRVVQGNDEMRLCAIPAHMLSASHSENADHRNRKPEHYDRVNQPYPNNITA